MQRQKAEHGLSLLSILHMLLEEEEISSFCSYSERHTQHTEKGRIERRKEPVPQDVTELLNDDPTSRLLVM